MSDQLKQNQTWLVSIEWMKLYVRKIGMDRDEGDSGIFIGKR